MSNIEHPKSAVNRLIAQNKVSDIEISEPNYTHKYISSGNKNIFTCTINVLYKKERIVIMSREYLTKKECDRDAYDQILALIQHGPHQTKNTLTSSYLDSAVVESMSRLSTSTVTNSVNSNLPTPSVPVQNYLSNLLERCRERDDVVYVVVDLENIAKIDKSTIESAVRSNPTMIQKTVEIIQVAGFCSSVKSSADIVVRSNRKDAVDHYIGYLIGLLEANMTERQLQQSIYLITRDKFGSCLQDFCTNVVHCSDVADFVHCVSS
ncbi:hypothetical protein YASMINEVIRUS_217 [Yasminevirus sp. GU-2018]|uniref:Uncharacterized protein n=1 Tax=Yasminevirus sp. GU-2018 TaxID=2420051 RepID=A0A5K0U8D6_9VIRU|nr:hypothetical protein YASMINEVIRUS_217 [Yasminevirus sp. GU-2018]